MTSSSEDDLQSHIEKHDSYYAHESFFPRLQKDWCEPVEQLHSGGWEITRDMASYVEKALKHPSSIKALDLCCGEGSTANYLSRERNWQVTGIDVNEKAIEKAKADALKYATGFSSSSSSPARLLSSLVSLVVSDSPKSKNNKETADFLVLSAFKMDSLPDDSFDVVYGQDPDALDSPQRLLIFKSVYRILKPNGIFTFHHHWIPGFGWSSEDLDKIWARDGTRDLSADHYVKGLEEAGFEIIIKDDITKLATSHLKSCFANNQARAKREGEQVLDKWLQATVQQIDEGKSFGIRVVAVKKSIS